MIPYAIKLHIKKLNALLKLYDIEARASCDIDCTNFCLDYYEHTEGFEVDILRLSDVSNCEINCTIPKTIFFDTFEELDTTTHKLIKLAQEGSYHASYLID